MDPDLRRDDGVFGFPTDQDARDNLHQSLTTILLLNPGVFFTKFIIYEKRTVRFFKY